MYLYTHKYVNCIYIIHILYILTHKEIYFYLFATSQTGIFYVSKFFSEQFTDEPSSKTVLAGQITGAQESVLNEYKNECS